MLPAPLSVNRPSPSPIPTSRLSGTSEGGPESSRQRLISSPQSADDRYDTPDNSSSIPLSSRYTSPTSAESSSNGTHRPVRNSVETNPFVLSNSQRRKSEYDQASPTADSEEYSPGNFTPSPSAQSQIRRARGVSLTDNGPVPGPDGVRRVARKRQSQQSPPQNRYSRGSTYLPPGAAMPQPGGHGGAY